MTRELKLSLILGFSLVLIVTVLISDYLSKARTSRLDGTSPTPPVAIVPPKVEDLIPAGQLGAEPRRIADAGTTSSEVIPASNAKPAKNEYQPVVFGPGGVPTGRDAQLKGQANGKVNGLDPSGKPAETPDNQGAAPDRIHTVASGDTFYNLSKQYYRDPKFHKELMAYNGLKSDNLKIGTELKIPSIDVLTHRVTKPRMPQPLNAQADKPAMPEGDPKFALNDSGEQDGIVTPLVRVSDDDQVTMYKVKSGDTLGDIARRELGTSKRAREIQELNRGIDETRLRIGMDLKLPPR